MEEEEGKQDTEVEVPEEAEVGVEVQGDRGAGAEEAVKRIAETETGVEVQEEIEEIEELDKEAEVQRKNLGTDMEI